MSNNNPSLGKREINTSYRIERNSSKKRDLSPGREMKAPLMSNQNQKEKLQKSGLKSTDENLKNNEINKIRNTKRLSNKNEKSDNNINNIELSDLLYKKEDDYETVVNKNLKLRSLVVQASNKLTEFSEKLLRNEENHKKEKETILKELDRITENYQKYAESHKTLIVLEEQFQKLKSDYEHNYTVLLSYQDSISVFIKDYMNLYHLLSKFLGNKFEKNPFQFLCDIKELIFENLRKYQNSIDAMNFQNIYDEYINLINPSSIGNKEFKRFSNFTNNSNHENSQPQSKNNSPTNSGKSNFSNIKLISQNVKFIKEINQNSKRYPSPSLSPDGEKRISRRSKSKEPPSKSHKRDNSIDQVVDNKKKNIEKMDSNIKKFFDQANTQEEIHSYHQIKYDNSYMTENICNFNHPHSKNYYNGSNSMGNINETRSNNPSSHNLAIVNLRDKELEVTPEFKSHDDKKVLFATVIKDFQGIQKGELNFKKGERVEILSININNGNYQVSLNGKRGYVKASYLQPDFI